MDTYTCKNCGKENPISREGSIARKFCNRDCQKAYYAKKEAAAAAAKVVASDKRKPLVDNKQCRKCKYRYYGRDHYSCGFLFIKGYSRTSLHPEGLTPECHEFEPRQRKHRYQAPIK